MCVYFFRLQDTPGSTSGSLGPESPSFWTQTFLMLEYTRKPYTSYHAPSHAPSNQNQCTILLYAMHLPTKTNAPFFYMPCTFQPKPMHHSFICHAPSNQNQCTILLYAMHLPTKTNAPFFYMPCTFQPKPMHHSFICHAPSNQNQCTILLYAMHLSTNRAQTVSLKQDYNAPLIHLYRTHLNLHPPFLLVRFSYKYGGGAYN